jgi:catechol 2,3-dioxygenase-like lactoylglutathione lyase family enzyme
MERPFSIKQLDHIVLRTPNLPRLRDFYLDLGCTLERDISEKYGMVQLRLGISLLDIVDVNGRLGQAGGAAPGPNGRNLDHFAVRVEPFDQAALLAFCEARGIETVVPATPLFGAEGFGPALYLHDPDGNRVELKGPPDKIVEPH